MQSLVTAMKTRGFAVAIDGSNDTGLEKMNPNDSEVVGCQ